jgi:hypothetical protein
MWHAEEAREVAAALVREGTQQGHLQRMLDYVLA